MRTTITLPDDLFRQAKAHAAMTGTSLKALVTACLVRGLRDGIHPEEELPRPRSPLPFVREAQGKSIPALSNRELHALLEADEVDRAIQR